MKSFSWTLMEFSTQLLVSIPFFKSEMLLNLYAYWEANTGYMLPKGLRNLSSLTPCCITKPSSFPDEASFRGLMSRSCL